MVEKTEHVERKETRNTLVMSSAGLTMLGAIISLLIWDRLKGGKSR